MFISLGDEQIKGKWSVIIVTLAHLNAFAARHFLFLALQNNYMYIVFTNKMELTQYSSFS